MKARLPATLADVPEVSFAEHLSHAMPAASAELHFISTIEKIHHVNQKKTDAYIELMREHRPDLAGLPFLLGDACRLKSEISKQFAVETAKIREVQRGLLTINSLVQQSDSMPALALDTERKREDLIISVLARADSKGWGPEAEGHGLFSVLDSCPRHDANADAGVGSESSRDDQLPGLPGRLGPHPSPGQAGHLLQGTASAHRGGAGPQNAARSGLCRHPRQWAKLSLARRGPASSEAIVRSGRTDLVPRLIDVLGQDDPRNPRRTRKRKSSRRWYESITCIIACFAMPPPPISAMVRETNRLMSRTSRDKSPFRAAPSCSTTEAVLFLTCLSAST